MSHKTEIEFQRGLSKNRRDDGTTTGQGGASLPQLAAISCRRRVDGTAWQLTTGQVSIYWVDEALDVATGQT